MQAQMPALTVNLNDATIYACPLPVITHFSVTSFPAQMVPAHTVFAWICQFLPQGRTLHRR